MHSVIDNLTIFVSQIPFLVGLWVLCAILAIVFDKKHGKYIAYAMIVAIILHFIVTEGIIKHLLPTISDAFFRQRPWEISGSSIVPLGKHYADSSFPSSHMASTLAMLTIFTYYYRKTLFASIVFAIAMAFARMHNGMHFPSDIIAGSLLGIIYGLLSIKIANEASQATATARL